MHSIICQYFSINSPTYLATLHGPNCHRLAPNVYATGVNCDKTGRSAASKISFIIIMASEAQILINNSRNIMAATSNSEDVEANIDTGYSNQFLESTHINFHKGSFTNYVYRCLAFFDPPSPWLTALFNKI